MKNSNELLGEILTSLKSIEGKIDSDATKKDKGGTSIGAAIVLATLFKGKKGEDAVNLMANSVKKLNTELEKTDVKKLNSLIDAIKSYQKIPAEDPKKRKTGGLAQSAKDMGLALLYTAGGVAALAVTFFVASKYLGMKPIEVLGFVVLTSVALALSMIIISGADAVGTKINHKALSGITPPPPGKDRGKTATQSAKDMGIALMFIAGGILAFAVTLMLVPKALGVKNPLIGMGVIVLVIAAMAGVFWLLGKVAKTVAMGVLVGAAVALGMAALAWGVMKFVDTAKKLQGLGDTTATKKKLDSEGNVQKRGMFGQMIAGIGPGLGMMGLILVSAIALFAILGGVAITGIGAAVIFGGIAVALGTAKALTEIADSIVKVNETMNKVGGEEGMKKVSRTIELMIGGVTTAVIKGVMGSVDADNNGNLSIREIYRFRRIKRVIRMVGNVSESLSKFAQGLKAFSKVGEIASLEYKEEEITDKDGNKTTQLKPVIGGSKIHVTVIAKAIADTFGLFVKTMVDNTTNLHRNQAAALRKLARALTGGGGLISGISQFAEALKTFSQFGAKQQIWVPAQYDGPEGETDPKKRGNLIAGTGVSVPIQVISDSIVSTFSAFVEKMASAAEKFEISGPIGRKMVRFTEALMGKQRSGIGKLFAREKPGILSGITAFSETLTAYAQYGKDGKVPVRDPKTGDVISTMTMNEVADSMVKSISDFVSEFEKSAGAANLEGKAKNVQDKITSITNIVTQFDTLATTGEGIEKLANSLGLLATNIGLLVTNTAALDTAKLQSLATITAQHAVVTKGVPIAPTTPTAVTATTASAAPVTDWNKVGDIIAEKIGAKLAGVRNGEFNFTFYDGNSGGKLEIKEK